MSQTGNKRTFSERSSDSISGDLSDFVVEDGQVDYESDYDPEIHGKTVIPQRKPALPKVFQLRTPEYIKARSDTQFISSYETSGNSDFMNDLKYGFISTYQGDESRIVERYGTCDCCGRNRNLSRKVKNRRTDTDMYLGSTCYNYVMNSRMSFKV